MVERNRVKSETMTTYLSALFSKKLIVAFGLLYTWAMVSIFWHHCITAMVYGNGKITIYFNVYGEGLFEALVVFPTTIFFLAYISYEAIHDYLKDRGM